MVGSATSRRDHSCRVRVGTPLKVDSMSLPFWMLSAPLVRWQARMRSVARSISLAEVIAKAPSLGVL